MTKEDKYVVKLAVAYLLALTAIVLGFWGLNR
jgi:hypothetical protein